MAELHRPGQLQAGRGTTSGSLGGVLVIRCGNARVMGL